MSQNLYNYDEEELQPTLECPTCYGEAECLGGLGRLIWFRCRFCGMEFFIDAEQEEG
jgi:hypothetical protein